MRIIGFGAHPDDVEIFFFGLLAVYRAAGHEIGWVGATDGAARGGGGGGGARRPPPPPPLKPTHNKPTPP